MPVAVLRRSYMGASTPPLVDRACDPDLALLLTTERTDVVLHLLAQMPAKDLSEHEGWPAISDVALAHPDWVTDWSKEVVESLIAQRRTEEAAPWWQVVHNCYLNQCVDQPVGSCGSVDEGCTHLLPPRDITARTRKSADLGANVTVLAGARIGRDLQIGDRATIGANGRLAAGVTVTANTLVPQDTIAQQEDIYNDPQTTRYVAPWLPTQGQNGLSDGIGTNTRWSVAGLSNSYNGAVLSHNFAGEFEVIESWNTLHMGVGLVHGSTVAFQDINGHTINQGYCWANLTFTGFPCGYAGTYKGYDNARQLSHIRWLRQGMTVSIQRATGPSGPCSHLSGSPYSIPEADTVVVGLGEGSRTNPAGLLQLVSCTEN